MLNQTEISTSNLQIYVLQNILEQLNLNPHKMVQYGPGFAPNMYQLALGTYEPVGSSLVVLGSLLLAKTVYKDPNTTLSFLEMLSSNSQTLVPHKVVHIFNTSSSTADC